MRRDRPGTAGGTVNISGYDLDIVPSQVAAKVIPSVVCIQNYQQSQSQLPFAQTLSGEEQLTLAAEGSGIVYTEDGYIITNAHVVENSSLLKVVLNNEEVYEAKLIGSDADTDLALLKIEATGLTPIEIGDYDALAVGDFVMAVGNPGGIDFELRYLRHRVRQGPPDGHRRRIHHEHHPDGCSNQPGQLGWRARQYGRQAGRHQLGQVCCDRL